jgi:hypothetical protein
MAIENINNGESGSSVRTKLNQVITKVNTTVSTKQNITLTDTTWTLNGTTSEWEYVLTDADIIVGSTVSFVPYSASVPAAQAAQIYPYSLVGAGQITFYAPGLQTAPATITGQLTIVK